MRTIFGLIVLLTGFAAGCANGGGHDPQRPAGPADEANPIGPSDTPRNGNMPNVRPLGAV